MTNTTSIDLLEKYEIKYPGGGWDLPEGWTGLVDELIEDLLELGWDKNLGQVKSKFGGLRFYIDVSEMDEDTYRAVQARIRKAEDESFKICEVCGEPGERTGKGWIETLCPNCQTR
jgi:hypothetical protein